MAGTRIAALALALGLVLGGCGGEDEGADEFREGYSAAVERLNELDSGIEESERAQPGAEIAREFDRVAKTAARTRADLRALDPPDEAREEFDELLAAMGKAVRDIRAVADAAREDDQERFQEAGERLTESSEEVREAESALKDAVED